MSAIPEGPGALNPAAYYGPLFNVVEETSEFSDAPSPTVALNAIVNFAARYGNIGCVEQDSQFQTLHLFGMVIGPPTKGRKTSSAAIISDLFESIDCMSASFSTLNDSEALAGIQRLGSIASGEGIMRPMYQGAERRLLLSLDSMSQFVKMAERNGNYAKAVINRAFDSGVIDAGGWNPMSLEDAHLCILTHATPEDLRASRTGRVLGPEVLGRFIPVYSVVGKRQRYDFRGWPVNRLEFASRLILANVAELTQGEPVTPGMAPLFRFKVHPEAAGLWASLRAFPDVFPFESDRARQYGERLGQNGQRLACTLASMNGEREVKPEAVEAALAWVDYACRTLDFVHGKPLQLRHRQHLESLGLRMAERVARCGGPVSIRELVQWVCRKGDVRSATAYEALRLATYAGWLGETSDRTGQRGPSTGHVVTLGNNSFPPAFPPQTRNNAESAPFDYSQESQ